MTAHRGGERNYLCTKIVPGFKRDFPRNLLGFEKVSRLLGASVEVLGGPRKSCFPGRILVESYSNLSNSYDILDFPFQTRAESEVCSFLVDLI